MTILRRSYLVLARQLARLGQRSARDLFTPARRLADLICDRRPAGSHIPQLTLAARRQFSSRVRARTPDSNGGENIPNQDNQRVNQCC
jgi:hypothetical protein